MLNMITKKLLNICPRVVWMVAFLAAGLVAGCSHSREDARVIDEAEVIAAEFPDSALALLEAIDPSELSADSTKAKYFYVLASVHDRQGRIALSDSMISFSADYYRGKDLKRSMRSATLSASFKWHTGERETARRMLDSLSTLSNVPDSLLIEPLRNIITLFAYKGGHSDHIKRLMAIDSDDARRVDYQYWLYFALMFEGKADSALEVIDALIAEVSAEEDYYMRNIFEYEKVAAMMDAGRYRESLILVDTLMARNTDLTGTPFLHLWKSLGQLNMHRHGEAAAELATADSLAAKHLSGSQDYYNSFATVIHTVLDYQKTGRVSLIPIAKVNNPQRDNLSVEQTLRQEASRRALEAENKRLLLKAKNQRQASLLIITVLAALLVTGALIWYALDKKRKSVETLESNEILQKLVAELKSTQADASVNDKLRRAMLQQLGIIKMVAETPTEQNREMLRRLSSIEGDTPEGKLVNWPNVFEIIDNLFAGFYTRLHDDYGEILSDKEEQIIVLMMAGFSTKEMSVITSQTMATIYTRKSTIRRKLGVAEKEDIVAFIRSRQAD